MLTALLLLLAVLPALVICYLILRADKHEKEDKVALLGAFATGAIITFPVWKIESWFSSKGLDDPQNLWLTLVFSFGVVALCEEVIKLAALLGYAFPRPFFNEPMDGIVYAVMVGMGFATVENVLYANQMSVTTMIVRAFTAVPAHGIFAVITGYFVGLAKFDHAHRWKLITQGFLLAFLLHGLYDFLILQESYEWLGGLVIVGLLLSFYYSQRLIRLHQNESPFRQNQHSA